MLFVSFPLLLLIFFVFNFCQFDHYVSWHVPPLVYPARDSLHFLDLCDCFLSHVREVFSYYLFKYFLQSFLSLFSFWDPYNANVGVFNVVPEVSKWSSFLFILYSLFCSMAVISNILSSNFQLT